MLNHQSCGLLIVQTPVSPKFVPENAGITYTRNSAAKWDPNRIDPPSKSIVTCSERQKEDGRIPVVPLALLSLWEGTTYTEATRPNSLGGVETQKIELSPLTTKPKSIRSADKRYAKPTSSAGLHKEITNRYMVLDMHSINPPNDPHSHEET